MVGLLLPLAVLAGSPEFQAGVAASKRGSYEEAVQYFERAREQGLDTPALHHNLGVAYFKLGRFERAREAFRRAAESPGMRALSHYNLGLVAQQEGHDEAARFWFRKAYDEAETRRLRRLAASRLGLSKQEDAPYRAYLEGFGGYDSNPGLADEDADPAGDRDDVEGDAVLGAFGVVEALLLGDWKSGLTVRGSGYADFHPELDDENLASLTGGLGGHHALKHWRHEFELLANQLWLGGDAFQTSGRVGLRSVRQLGPNLAAGLRLRGQYDEGSDANDFDYITGWSLAARTSLLGRAAAWRWRLFYEFTYEDRENLRVDDGTGVSLFSVSPLRHEVSASVERPLIGRLSGEIRAGYRRSDYRDEEIRADGGRGRRHDDRFEVGGGLAHPLWSGWIGRLESTYWNNRSECDADACDRFDYDRFDVLLSIGRTF